MITDFTAVLVPPTIIDATFGVCFGITVTA